MQRNIQEEADEASYIGRPVLLESVHRASAEGTARNTLNNLSEYEQEQEDHRPEINRNIRRHHRPDMVVDETTGNVQLNRPPDTLANNTLGHTELMERAKWHHTWNHNNCDRTACDWILNLEEVRTSTTNPTEERKTAARAAANRPIAQTLATDQVGTFAEGTNAHTDSDCEQPLSELDRVKELSETLSFVERDEQSNTEHMGGDNSIAPHGANAKACGYTKVVNPKCDLCSSQNKLVKHLLVRCTKFLAMSEAQRTRWLLQGKKCMNCFRDKHKARACESKRRCTVCKERHHQLIHNVASTFKATKN
jgi:hypothetical protein